MIFNWQCRCLITQFASLWEIDIIMDRVYFQKLWRWWFFNIFSFLLFDLSSLFCSFGLCFHNLLRYHEILIKVPMHSQWRERERAVWEFGFAHAQIQLLSFEVVSLLMQVMSFALFFSELELGMHTASVWNQEFHYN